MSRNLRNCSYTYNYMHEHLTCDELVTPEEAYQRFRDNGVSVAAWAVRNGFNPAIVYAVLRGGRKCIRGQSHDIAVSLGIKPRRGEYMASRSLDNRGSLSSVSGNEQQGSNGPKASGASENAKKSENAKNVLAEGEVSVS